MTETTWSHEQNTIFGWFATATSSLLVRARAGTGKTTTIVEGIKHAPKDVSVLLAAFNKKIATELAERLDHPNAEALTLHSVGFAAVRRFWTRVRLEQKRGERSFDLAKRAAGTQAPDAMLSLVAKLMTVARECVPLATGPDELHALAWEHDCIPDEEWDAFGWDEAEVCKVAYRALEYAAEKTDTIDFSDMIFLPVRNNWLRPKYDLVVIDECQDMNKAQVIIATRVAKGRICVVGDDRQAIYKFRGADAGVLDRLKKELNAAEMSLTTTYRCAKAIVREANAIVTDYKAADFNPEGIVRTIGKDTVLDDAKGGDVILSRLNAPLVSLCMRAFALGIAARIEGRDVAAGLKKLVRELAKGPASRSIPQFLTRLDSWQAAQLKRVSRGNGAAEAKGEAIRDKAEALQCIAEGATSVNVLVTRIDDIFTQIKSGNAITLSSVHKSKGLEWKRVFILRDTLRDSNTEELNIQYVAITRAINELVYVTDDDVPEPEKKDNKQGQLAGFGTLINPDIDAREHVFTDGVGGNLRMAAGTPEEIADRSYRASGDVPCVKCDRALRAHPLVSNCPDHHGEPFLHIDCLGNVVKL